jgi:hypothetical protein
MAFEFHPGELKTPSFGDYDGRQVIPGPTTEGELVGCADGVGVGSRHALSRCRDVFGITI